MTNEDKQKLAQAMVEPIKAALNGNIASDIRKFKERLDNHLIENLPPHFEITERLNDRNEKRIILLPRGSVIRNFKVDEVYVDTQELTLATIAHEMYEIMAKADDVDQDEYMEFREKLIRL